MPCYSLSLTTFVVETHFIITTVRIYFWTVLIISQDGRRHPCFCHDPVTTLFLTNFQMDDSKNQFGCKQTARCHSLRLFVATPQRDHDTPQCPQGTGLVKHRGNAQSQPSWLIQQWPFCWSLRGKFPIQHDSLSSHLRTCKYNKSTLERKTMC